MSVVQPVFIRLIVVAFAFFHCIVPFNFIGLRNSEILTPQRGQFQHLGGGAIWVVLFF